MKQIQHQKYIFIEVLNEEILKFESDWSIKISPFEDTTVKKIIEEEELIDNLTTFNLETTKDTEKKAKDNLVLPFYKDTQIAGQVKIQGQVESKSETQGKIYYEPDSGDDWDDEDPDDDLDF